MIRTAAPASAPTTYRPSLDRIAARPFPPSRAAAASDQHRRGYEVAALRADGSLCIAQGRAPAIPFFEQAFSAFARGTLIQTAHGPIGIEDLQPGDRVETATGALAEVIWIGSSTFIPADTGRRTPMVRIMADSFGQDRPGGFVTLGPSARILQTPPHLRAASEGQPMLTPVREFVDGVNVIEVVPPTPVKLFHLCLSHHAAINAGGIMVESFHPGEGADDLSPSMQRRFLSMFPRIAELADFGPLAYPRAPQPETAE